MSRVPVIPNAENCTQQELQTAAKAAPTLAGHQRLMIMLALIQGFSADQVARLYGKTRRTIRNHLRRFNEQGIDGLIEKKSSGRPRKISPQQSEQYIGLIEKPAAAGQTHWTGRKFHGYLREQLHQEIGYSTSAYTWCSRRISTSNSGSRSRSASANEKVGMPWTRTDGMSG